MAQDAATLLVRIEATTMQLRKELAAADRAVSGSSSKIDKELGLVDKAFARMGLNAEQSRKAIGSAMAGITAAAAGGVAGLGALVVSTANSAREIQNLSQVANASTTEFQRYAVAAKTVGVEQEKLADILKDVNDRVGDFLTTGGGEMKDFFENIAPRIGVTAEQFRKLSGPQSLQLFYNSLEKANLSQAEMTFYMESMADETTALIPLLRDGGAGFSAMADEAERLGLVMSEKTLKQFDQFNAQMDTAKMAAGGFGTQIATEALPALSELNGLLIDFAQDSEAASVIGDALGVVLKGVATVAIGLSTTFANLGRAIGGLAAAASAAASMEFAQASSIIDQFTADNEAATAQAEQRIKKLWTGEYADAGKRAVEVNRTVSESSVQLGAAAKKSADDQKKAIDEKLKSLDALVAKYDPAAKAQAAYDAGIKLADEALKNNTYTTEQYQKVVQGLYTDLNKPIWDKHNKQADEAAAAIKKIDDQLESVRDRLDPAGKAARDFADEQDFLKKAVDEGRLSLEEYNKLLPLLGKEYEENTRATSDWAKWTEGALDRVDGAFADAWRNIGDGFDGFRDSLTNAFKQMLAELAHMAITRPIVMQIGAALGIGGAAGQATSMLGGGSGGGFDFGKLLNYGQTAYSMFTGVGPAVMAGYQSGGIMGGLQGAAGYYGNLASSAWGTVSGWLGGSAAAGAGSAAGTGFGLGQSVVSGQIGNAAYAGAQAGAGSSLSGIAGNLGAIVGPIAGLYMALKGYGAISNGYDFKPKDFDDEFAGVRLGAKVINAYENGITKVFGDSSFLSKALRIPVSTIGGLMSSVFGGGWETKNYGMAFSVANGDFLGQSYEDQKKKGGLFGSDKKRTKYRSLDPETAAVLQETYDATQAGVADLFASLSLTVEEGSLDGLKLAREKISTKGKTEEEIQQAIAEWFGSAADAMTAELNKVFATGLDLDLEGMQAFVGNLTGVNEVLRYLDVEMYDASVAGGKLAEALSAAAGGLESLATNSQTYYSAFFSDAEKVEDTIDSITRAFEAADVELVGSREAYRAMVEDIDLTTEAGQEMFSTLMQLSGQAAQYFSIVEQQAAQATAAANAALFGAVDTAYAALQRSIAAQQQEIQQAASATTSNINALTGIGNSLDAALKRLRGTSDDTVKSLRAQAVMTLNSALVTARAGSSLAGFAGLQDALDVASEMDTALYGSLQDFEREQGRTANLIAELEKVNGKQLTAEEQMLEQYEKQMQRLDAQLAFAQAQLDALNGIDNSVMGVAAAIAAMNASVVAALGALPKGAAQANTPQNNGAIVSTLYNDLFGRTASADEVAYWSGRLGSGNLEYSDIAANMKQWASAADKEAMKQRGIPGFAAGGFHSGGLRLVGENGPELEVTGPSRIYNASQTAAMLGGGDSSAAIASLQRTVEGQSAALRSIAKHTMQTAKRVEFLERWDFDGLPPERKSA
ncbi:hypothetical protein [Stutzerimonas kunmingensis]|uniref:hypothetical protein n=1 Tax=Stutzerimonas kunmingensis TaxID=1211807 RepID=UPI00241C46E8|nr:hypothetical protein [Stutzerimonas kunmingensis]